MIFIANGKTCAQIARILKISEKTVYAQRASIVARTGLESIADWVHYLLFFKKIVPKTLAELGILPTDSSDRGLLEQNKGDRVLKQVLPKHAKYATMSDPAR